LLIDIQPAYEDKFQQLYAQIPKGIVQTA